MSQMSCNLLKTTYLYSIDVILLAMLLLLYYSMFSFYIACLYTKNDIQTKSNLVFNCITTAVFFQNVFKMHTKANEFGVVQRKIYVFHNVYYLV